MNERTYKKGINKLRSGERLKRLEIEKVVTICQTGRKFKTLLDIGTGSGLFAEAFSNSGVMISGIDMNAEMIDSAKKYLPHSEFLISSAEDIPFNDSSFDATFFGMVFHEVTDYKKSLSEAYRVTRFYTFILEWQYKQEDFGPPIEHRLKEEYIRNLAISVGYNNFTSDLLNNSALYILKK